MTDAAFRSALSDQMEYAFTALEAAVRRKHPDAVFTRGLDWGDERAFIYQRSRWPGMEELLINVTAEGSGADQKVFFEVKSSGGIHDRVPVKAPEKGDVFQMAGLLAAGYVALLEAELALGLPQGVELTEAGVSFTNPSSAWQITPAQAQQLALQILRRWPLPPPDPTDDDELRKAIQEGIDSGPPAVVDLTAFARKRSRLSKPKRS